MNKKNIDQLITDALEIEATAAAEAGMVGYMARALVQATIPHKNTSEIQYVRKNGNYRLIITAGDPLIGLPYGTAPRLLLAWIATEAVRTQSNELVLGRSMSHFMGELGLLPTGGRWGTITRLKDQSNRLFACFIRCSYTSDDSINPNEAQQFIIADKQTFWWHPKDPSQESLFDNTVTLSQRFFDEIINNPVPIDLRALRALKHSCMALDIYNWLTYRNSYLRNKTSIPWRALQLQFGSSYPMTGQGTRDFKKKFLIQLKAVQAVYPAAKLETSTEALTLIPSPPHIQFKQ